MQGCDLQNQLLRVQQSSCAVNYHWNIPRLPNHNATCFKLELFQNNVENLARRNCQIGKKQRILAHGDFSASAFRFSLCCILSYSGCSAVETQLYSFSCRLVQFKLVQFISFPLVIRQFFKSQYFGLIWGYVNACKVKPENCKPTNLNEVVLP